MRVMISQRTERARTLRKQATEAEVHLWRHLRNRAVAEYKFRRQEPIGPYFVDFACRDARLAIEVDGGQHYSMDGTLVSRDEVRRTYIGSMGWRMLRFTDREVLMETSSVLDVIIVPLTTLTLAFSLKGEGTFDGARRRSLWLRSQPLRPSPAPACSASEPHRAS